MKKIPAQVTCPTCNGNGTYTIEINIPKVSTRKQKRALTHLLNYCGFGPNDIKELVGYSSRQSVYNNLENKGKVEEMFVRTKSR